MKFIGALIDTIIVFVFLFGGYTSIVHGIGWLGVCLLFFGFLIIFSSFYSNISNNQSKNNKKM